MKAVHSLIIALLLCTSTTLSIAAGLDEGITAWRNGAYDRAYQIWRPLAENGDPDAQMYMGVLYSHGQAVPADMEKAAYWFEQAANNDNPHAQQELGLLYEMGEGVEKNFEIAKYWYHEAVAQGYCPRDLSDTGGLGDD